MVRAQDSDGEGILREILVPGVPGLIVEPTESVSKTDRISALDFTKGALVLIMVLYHWINYFIGPQWGYYRYLRFLTPSFIFVTGFMISGVYLSKYDVADTRLPKRLFTRGIKLMAVFLILNAARTLLVPALHTGALGGNLLDPRNIFTIFVSGNFPIAGAKLISFSILVPISYLLMLSGMLIVPFRSYRYTFHVVCLLLFSSILVLGMMGAQCENLEFIAIGMLGVVVGFAPIAKINKFIRHPYAIGFAYLGYVIAITIWNVPFSLQVVGVPLSLAAIYLIGTSNGKSGRAENVVILLGKYSLFGYISQIAILQVLSVGLRHFNLNVVSLAISFVAVIALTIASVELVDRARAKAKGVDRLYKIVFA
jgi:peptidoglycan/LPS O-acetylase OafA/YrhL